MAGDKQSWGIAGTDGTDQRRTCAFEIGAEPLQGPRSHWDRAVLAPLAMPNRKRPIRAFLTLGLISGGGSFHFP